MKKIRVESVKGIHVLTHCNSCDWQEDDECCSMQQLRNKIISHVKKTGHSVTLEIGNHTQYSLEHS